MLLMCYFFNKILRLTGATNLVSGEYSVRAALPDVPLRWTTPALSERSVL